MIAKLKGVVEKKFHALSQAITGVQKKYFERFLKNPKIGLPEVMGGPKSLDAAGEVVEAAEKKAFGKAAEATAKEINDPALTTARRNALKAAEELEEVKRLSKTDPDLAKEYLSDPEVGAKMLKGKRGTQSQLDQPSSSGSKKALLSKQMDEINEVLGDNFPEVKEALAQYGNSKAREQVLDLLPVLKNGDPSITRLVLTAVGRTAVLPFGVSVPAVNAAAQAMTKLSLEALEQVAKNPNLSKVALAEIARRRSNANPE